MKRTYEPTEADRLTGAKLRDLRKLRGETLRETTERSGLGRNYSTLAATERGERRLTEIEATKLAAHFSTTADSIIVKLPKVKPLAEIPVETEQQFLGNDDPKPALFAVPSIGFGGVDLNANIVTIDRNAPMTPEQYRAEVWVPYLEARYATEQKAS